MLQQDLLPSPESPEPRCKRSEFELPACLRRRALELAAEVEVSSNEVLVQCLLHGLWDEVVLLLIDQAATRKRVLGRGHAPVDSSTTKSQFLLPASVKLRLRELKAKHDLSFNEIVLRCLQHGLFDHLVLHRIQQVAASRTKRIGRIVRKEDLHRAA